MKTLFLLVNSTCDITCGYCFYTTGHEIRSRFRVTTEQADLVADRIASTGFDVVILTGGDPLHSRFKRETYTLIAELKVRGLRVIVNTSAVRLTDEDLDIIITLDVDRVDVSIDSHIAEVHDAQRGRHADTVWSLQGFIARSYTKLACTIVVTELNVPTLFDTITWLRSCGVKDVRIQRAFLPEGSSQDGDAIMCAMQSATALLHSPHVAKYVGLTNLAFQGKGAPYGSTCRMGKEYFVCDARGKITPCFHRDDIVLGNLLDDTVSDLQRSFGNHELVVHDVPPCFGGHCASLFDIPTFWRES